MYRQKEFSRYELYRLVWERPVLSVAKEIGVSDVEVAKACRKAGIPLPSRGHWAIVKAGRTVKAPPLPKAQAGQPDSASILSTGTNFRLIHIIKRLRHPGPFLILRSVTRVSRPETDLAGAYGAGRYPN